MRAPAPPRLIEGRLPTEAMVDDIVVAKFAEREAWITAAYLTSAPGPLGHAPTVRSMGVPATPIGLRNGAVAVLGFAAGGSHAIE